MKTQGTLRDLLTRIGIGQFNATGIINMMYFAPATTDPKSASVILLVRHLQAALIQIGFPINMTGYLDRPTAAALDRAVGPGWESRSWADNVAAIVDALVRQKTVGTAYPTEMDLLEVAAPVPPASSPTLGFWDPPILPAIPGGIITYGVLGVLAYNFLKKRKR